METLLEVPLDRISVSETNSIFRAQTDLTQQGLQELTDSIKRHGVLQSIAIRPNPDKEGHFILIAGERRFHASGFAGLATIPARILYVSEEVALQMQITENIQRKHVHPLDEAIGYKRLLEHDNNQTTATLAATFGKSETYIAQRLKLNDLVKEARKDFYANKMNITHAVLIARLQPTDQREIVKEYTNFRGGYGRTVDLQHDIERNVMNCLSKAPFDVNDANLHKPAGACVTCPLRSGNAPLLFGDIEAKDRCFSRTCFETKVEKHVMAAVTTAIETQPELVFLRGYSEVSPAVAELLATHDITPLRNHDDFSDYGQGKKVLGLWLSGSNIGKTERVILRRPEKANGGNDPQATIDKIKMRIARGKELDQEKVYAKILNALKEHPTQKAVGNLPLLPSEEAFIWYVIYSKAGFGVTGDFQEALHLDEEEPEVFYHRLLELSIVQKAYMLRKVMLDQFGGNYPRSVYAYIIRQIAHDYGDIDIASYEKEQLAIQSKREGRQNEKIAKLQELVRPAKVAKARRKEKQK